MPAPKPQPTIVIDTREQLPWSFTLPTVRECVPTGADYSVQGFEAVIGIERKSLPDLVQSLTAGRERFDRSLAALRTRQWRALVVEGTFAQIVAGHYMSRATPTSIVGSLAAIMADGVPVFLAGDAEHAAAFAERLLLKFHKRALAAQQRAADPLDRFPAFIASVEARLEAGRTTYGDRSFERPPSELLAELEQEALDLAGWGFVLFERVRTMRDRVEAGEVQCEVFAVRSEGMRGS